MYLSKPLMLLICTFLFFRSNSQTNGIYNYQDLSRFFYAKHKDSLKKSWQCPALFKEKETQKKYKEIWDQRTNFLTAAIDNNAYIHDKEVFGYVENIIDQITLGNKQLFAAKPFLLIDRSASPNAYALGNNIIAVNLGLITFVQCREELALAIAHELSHNILSHPENAMKERAEWLTSDAYHNSINAVLDSPYERLSRLKKVLQNFSFDRNKHQQYHENDADSLAIILLKNSNIGFNADFFLRLDSADITYNLPLKNSIKDYFTSYNLPFDNALTEKRSRGLSSRNYNFNTTDIINDSLKTHPGCIERYKKTIGRSTKNTSPTLIPVRVQQMANKMLLWNLYNNTSLTPCLYRILLEKDKGQTDAWYDFMLSNIFFGLNYADNSLNRFNAVNIIQKELVSKKYYELQTMLEQMPHDMLEQYCIQLRNAGFWNNTTPEEKALKGMLYKLTLNTTEADNNQAKIAKDFIGSYPGSMYCELANIFSKK